MKEDSMSDLGEQKMAHSAETPQLLKKAEDLAKYLESRRKLYEDPETWSTQQELLRLFRKILISDLDYALEKKVEQILWNSCFKNFINHLQAATRDKNAKIKASAQVSLSAVLENASGFYILLLEEIRYTFKLTVPFLQNGSPYGTMQYNETEERNGIPTKASTNYICQHCLVHLGDIARYRNNMQQAETFYRHATTMAPSSGQPYNQIAILEASRSNKLSTVYFYIRAVCLAYPFPAAFTNLSKLLGKLAGLSEEGESRDLKERTAKINQHTFVPLFLRVQGLLHHSTHLSHCVTSTRLLSESLTTLVATEGLSTWQLLQILAINIWMWEHTAGGNDVSDRECLSKEEQLCLCLIADMQAALASAILLPIYTLKQDDSLLYYHGLPAARVLLEWVACTPSLISYPGWITRQLIWPGVAHLLNQIENLLNTNQEIKDNFTESDLEVFPLPEEYDLQAFKPLVPVFSKYNYKMVTEQRVCPTEKQLAFIRIKRIRDSCISFTKSPFSLLEKQDGGGWTTVQSQTADQQKPVIDVDQILQELQQEKGIEMFEDEDSDDNESIQWEQEPETLGKGILKSKIKPTDQHSSVGTTAAAPRYRTSRQNVAMAAILNQSQDNKEKIEEEKSENKRVVFLTPSPRDEKNKGSKDSSVKVQGGEMKPEANRTGLPGSSVHLDAKQNTSRCSTSDVEKSSIPLKASSTENQMNVKDLDLSRPPPSLHSNVRPPKLVSSPKQSAVGTNERSAVLSHEQSAFGLRDVDSRGFNENKGVGRDILPGISPLTLAESSFPKPLQSQLQGLSLQERRFEQQYPTLSPPGEIRGQPMGTISPLANFGMNFPQQNYPNFGAQIETGNSPLFSPQHMISPQNQLVFQHGASTGINQSNMFSPLIQQQQSPMRSVANSSNDSVTYTATGSQQPQAYSLFSGGSPWRGISSVETTPDSTPKPEQ